ncbi:MAG: B12-binding domain-containing radical SAM protein [Desulfomonile tiedjei]|nr:B12-binding domain-containing radical SAM protein [Desulfomonile tiedjei]
MKALLVSPRHPQTFWSFNSVLKMLGKKGLLPPLGLMTLAALLPKEWSLTICDMTVRDISEEEWRECDLVMISGLVSQHTGMVEAVREAKRRDKTVVVGGPWAFHMPEIFLDAGADIVVRGEGEVVMPQVLQALENGASGVFIEADRMADMETSPTPRYDLIDMDAYVDMPLQFSRGCPFQCDFCDVTLMLGRKVRTKSPEQIMRELQVLYDMGWRRAVFFVDDNLIGSIAKAKELLRKLIPWMEERGYPFAFYTQASVNLAADDELLELITRAGFYRVFLGIETPDKESLELVSKHQNVGVDLDEVCEKINRAGLQIIAGCIIGFDNERPGADQRLIDFAQRNHIPEMFATLLQASPGTTLFNRLQKENRLVDMAMTDNLGSQTALLNFIPTRPTSQIAEEFLRLYDVLYDPGTYLERCFSHFARMRPWPFRKARTPIKFSEFRAVAITLIRQGVLDSSRWTFWKYLYRAWRTFPDRLPNFVASCITAEHYYRYRHTIRKEIESQLLRRDDCVGGEPCEAVGART